MNRVLLDEFAIWLQSNPVMDRLRFRMIEGTEISHGMYVVRGLAALLCEFVHSYGYGHAILRAGDSDGSNDCWRYESGDGEVFSSRQMAEQLAALTPSEGEELFGVEGREGWTRAQAAAMVRRFVEKATP